MLMKNFDIIKKQWILLENSIYEALEIHKALNLQIQSPRSLSKKTSHTLKDEKVRLY